MTVFNSFTVLIIREFIRVLQPLNKTTLLVLLTSISLFATFSSAQNSKQRVPTKELVEGIKSRDGRWFEVEMIIFERKDNLDFRENFADETPVLEKARKWDLLRQQLQPNISLFLTNLPECHQDKNPLVRSPEQPALSPEIFYHRMQSYKELINNQWQFSNKLCLLPDESLSGYWAYDNEFTSLTKQELEFVPLDDIPEQVVAGDHDDFHDVYLLAEHNLQLKEHFYTLKRSRSLNPLLHIGWRQPGLSRRQSIPVYLVAGENYSDNYRYDGSAKIQNTLESLVDETIKLNNSMSAEGILQQDAVSNVERFIQQLQSGVVVDFKNNKLVSPSDVNLPEQAWQVDGYVQIHLNHYLFINSEFNFREPTTKQVNPDEFFAPLASTQPPNVNHSNVTSEADQSLDNTIDVNYLQNYYFKQNRRVYSGDIHYLDHPKFGILIQIRKYRH